MNNDGLNNDGRALDTPIVGVAIDTPIVGVAREWTEHHPEWTVF